MQRRGVFLARRIQTKMKELDGYDIPLGVLDATMYRDDFRSRLKQPEIRETRIDFDVSNRHLVLIDDVLFTGRTARSALDALMDSGATIQDRNFWLLSIVDFEKYPFEQTLLVVGYRHFLVKRFAFE